MNWNQLLPDLCRQAHATAAEKGFWDPEPSLARSRMLLLGELSELYEAVRKGQESVPCQKIPEMTCAEEELADIAIRLFDFCAGHDLELRAESNKISFGFDRTCVYLARSCLKIEKFPTTHVGDVFFFVRSLAFELGVDEPRLLWCIRRKMAYNETRPHKHGRRF